MTAIGNLWANIRIFVSNYTYYYGTLTNIALLLFVLGVIVIGTVRTAKLPQTPKKRGEIKYLEPSGETVERAAASLGKAVRFKTVTGDRAELEKLLGFLKERYKNVFSRAAVLVMPSGSLALHIKSDGSSGKKPVLLCGHMDVVPASGDWKHGAFSGFDDGSAVWGRGTLDCKGGMIAMLEALESLLKEGYMPKRDVYMSFGSDEETGGTGGSAKIAEMFRGRDIAFEFILNEGGSVSSAHMGNKLFPAAVIAVAEKGGFNIRITARAEGGHASLPGKKTAIGILSEAVCRLENAPMRRRLLPCVERYLKLSSPAFSYFQRFCLANNLIMRPMMYASFRNDKYIAPLFRTTFVPTQVKGAEAANMLPKEASATVNVRLLQGDTVEKVLEHIRAVLADLPVDVQAVSEGSPSRVSDTNTESYELICKTIEKHFGSIAVIPAPVTRSSDTVHFEDMAENVYRFSPIMMSRKQQESIHGENEYIRKDALGVAVEFYKTLLSSM